MRILFAGGGTGGHLYPGIAIARAVQRLRPDIKPFFIGAQRGVEPDVLPGTGYPYLLLDLHPLYRREIWNNWRTAVGLSTAWKAIGALVKEERPALVVGTGQGAQYRNSHGDKPLAHTFLRHRVLHLFRGERRLHLPPKPYRVVRGIDIDIIPAHDAMSGDRASQPDAVRETQRQAARMQ